jgi:TolA-binding protein
MKGPTMKKVRLFTVFALSGLMFASCASGPSKHSFGPYSEAENLYKKGNYPKAIEKYQEYLTANPQGNLAAIAQYYIGKSYAASGDTVKAVENFNQVINQYPGTSWADFSKEQSKLLQAPAKS